MAKSSSPAAELDKVIVRLPDGMRNQLKIMARDNDRSVNAEIVQRLKWSIDGDGLLKLKLSDETEAALFTDAAINNMDMEERAVQIIQAKYGQNEYKTTLDRVDNLANENLHLSQLVEHLEEKENSDFILYYSKVVQLFQFVNSAIHAKDNIPSDLFESALHLQALAKAEIGTLEKRYQDRIILKDMYEKSKERELERIYEEAPEDSNE